MIEKLYDLVETLLYSITPGPIFGVRAQGEKPMEPTLRSERPMDIEGFNEWCQHIRNEIIFGRQR